MHIMKGRIISVFTVLSCLAGAPALANWQYSGVYVGDGWYQDDGSRFVLSARGGASFGFGSIKNEMGALTSFYVYNETTGVIIPEGACYGDSCTGYVPIGYAELGSLPAAKDFESFSFAAGASIGWTLPNRPQWRLEAGWDHITESDYNASPMFDGQLTLQGTDSGLAIQVPSGSVHSTVSTDVISVMAFYDFFDGYQKPISQVIPYIGFGLGYADTTTVLNVADPYGDLSLSAELGAYGELDDNYVLHFYKSETSSANIAGILALGLSYGLTETMFVDFGARLTYIPKVKWKLSNSDGSQHRDWFSAENMIYANIMVGLRFEF